MYMYMYVPHTHTIIVVSFFLELLPTVLAIHGVKLFLSDKINQDPLENSSAGCVNMDRLIPTVTEAFKNTQTLRVVDGVWVNDLTGSNCRGGRGRNRRL